MADFISAIFIFYMLTSIETSRSAAWAAVYAVKIELYSAFVKGYPSRLVNFSLQFVFTTLEPSTGLSIRT